MVKFSRGSGDGWVRERRSEDCVFGKVAVLPAFAVENWRLQPCPDVERSTQCPPAWGGEKTFSGHFTRALPPFGSAGGSGKMSMERS